MHDMAHDPGRPQLAPSRRVLLERLSRGMGARLREPGIPPRRPGTPAPLSAHQSGILETLELFDGLYAEIPFRNQSLRLVLRGDLDVAALEWSLSQVLARHDVLRTTFPAADGDFRVEVAPAVPVRLQVLDLSHTGELPYVLEQTRHICQVQAATPLDPQHGPLIAYRLFKAAAEVHVLGLLIDHLLFDGWSFGVLIGELQAFYRARRRGSEPLVPPLPIQYADYAAWEGEALAAGRFGAAEAYWRAQLATRPAIVELPTRNLRREPQPFFLGTATVALDEEATDLARRFSRAQGATLFSTLLAAYMWLLGQYSGEADISVVSAMANRARPEVQGLIGGFMNGVILRAGLDGDASFLGLVGKVRGVVRGAIANQHMPLGRVLEDLHPGSDLFRTYFALQNYPVPSLDFPGLEVSLHDVNFGVTLWDLTTSLTDDGRVVTGHVGFNAELFSLADVQAVFDHYNLLLRAALTEPERPLRDLPRPPRMASEGHG